MDSNTSRRQDLHAHLVEVKLHMNRVHSLNAQDESFQKALSVIDEILHSSSEKQSIDKRSVVELQEILCALQSNVARNLELRDFFKKIYK